MHQVALPGWQVKGVGGPLNDRSVKLFRFKTNMARSLFTHAGTHTDTHTHINMKLYPLLEQSVGKQMTPPSASLSVLR